MIIKVDTVSGSHGHNAIDYSLEKDVKNKNQKPEFLKCNCLEGNLLTLEPPSPTHVWEQMKLRQAASKHRVADPFFRIEICPPMDKCKDWSKDEWEKFLDDAIRHLDNTDYLGKDNKVIGKHTDLAHCQWVASIHRDTDNYHIHLIANRITEDDRIQDGHRCKLRGKMAADALAQERGWTKAQDIPNKRIERIHADAMEVLKSMPKFSIDAYFDGMRKKGWVIDPKKDSKGIYRGYTIGERLYKADGSLSSTVTLKASELKHGRDLMVSKLEMTWRKLKQESYNASKRTNDGLFERKASKSDNTKDSQSEKQGMYQGNHRGRNEHFVPYSYNGKQFEIPEHIDNIIKSNITRGSQYEYDSSEKYPMEAEIVSTAAAIFIGLLMPYDAHVSCGGGGGGGSDDDNKKKRKDDEEWALFCARNASAHYAPKKKKGRRR